MGELRTEPFQFTFNGFLKVAFQGSRITSDAGLILVQADARRVQGRRLGKARTQMRSGVEGIPWKHGPPARDTSARAGVTAFGPGRWCDEHNLVGSAALGCIDGHPGQAKRKSR